MTQPELPPAKAKRTAHTTPKSAPAPAIVEYTPRGEKQPWRVEHFARLQDELPGLTPETLRELHSLLKGDVNARPRFLMQRIFGIRPVMIPLDAKPDDFTVLSRAEAGHALGLDEKAVRAELDAVRVGWGRVRKDEDRGLRIEDRNANPSSIFHPLPSSQELVDDEDQILRRHFFTSKPFEKKGRSAEEARVEKAWFVERVKESSRWLLNGKTQVPARAMLTLELRLRRAEEQCHALENLDGMAYEGGQEQLDRDVVAAWREYEALQKSYNGQVKTMQSLAPDFAVHEEEVRQEAVLGEATRRYQEYCRRPSQRLADGVHTAEEIQQLTRTNRQMPLPPYRFGLVVMLNQARAFLHDPNYEPNFSAAQLARLDAGFQGAVLAHNEATGAHVPDLLKEGPEGEYEELRLAPNAECGVRSAE